MAWFEQTFDRATQSSTAFTVRFKRFSADGQVVQEATLGAAPNGGFLNAETTAVTGTPDGGFAVAWTGKPALGASSIPFLRRYDAGGQLVGQEYQKFTTFGTSSPLPLALPDGSLVLVWSEATSSQEKSVFMLRFDAAMVPMGQPREIAASRTTGDQQFGAAVTGEGRIGLAWMSTPIGQQSPSSTTFASQIVDADGVPLTPAVTTTPPVQAIVGIQATTRSTGFSVFVESLFAFNRGSSERLGLVPVAPDGTVGSYTPVTQSSIGSVSDITGATTGPAATGFGIAAGPDDHFVTAYEGGTPSGANVYAEGH